MRCCVHVSGVALANCARTPDASADQLPRSTIASSLPTSSVVSCASPFARSSSVIARPLASAAGR